MPTSSFVYVIYIGAPQQKVWDALTTPEFQKQYWFGGHQDSTGRRAPNGRCSCPSMG
ncbi:MAG TPA: hypothetical protein VG309_01370 [Rhizomicrobium sp.]|nr:hypothetical protein [Rhizomicrobium sp.]